MTDRVDRLRDHVNYPHLDGDICLRCWAADEIERLLAERDDLQERLQVRSMELAQARQGRALLELERVQAENADIKERCDVLRIELANARTGKALLEVERLEAENKELRERLAAGFASSVVIDIGHDDVARKLRQIMRALEAMDPVNGGTQ